MACIGNFYYFGDKLVSTKRFDICDLENAVSLYEVVKIIRNKALFFEDHLKRLHRSAKLSEKIITWDDNTIFSKVNTLIQANNIPNGRLKFLFRYKENETPKFFAFYLNDITPEPKLYQKGAKTRFYSAVREKPGIKQINYRLRHNIKDYIGRHNIYEVLLTNTKGEITEGSKSNFFVIGKEGIITPPATTVLPGITRESVMQLCRQENIPVFEKAIRPKELPQFEAAFLSGTSIGILPLRSIEEIHFSTDHPTLKIIKEKYAEIVNNYVYLETNQ